MSHIVVCVLQNIGDNEFCLWQHVDTEKMDAKHGFLFCILAHVD